MRALYLKLSDEERALLDAVVADASASARRPVSTKSVIVRLVQDEAARHASVQERKGRRP